MIHITLLVVSPIQTLICSGRALRAVEAQALSRPMLAHRSARALFHPTAARFVPQTQHVNLRMVCQAVRPGWPSRAFAGERGWRMSKSQAPHTKTLQRVSSASAVRPLEVTRGRNAVRRGRIQRHSGTLVRGGEIGNDNHESLLSVLFIARVAGREPDKQRASRPTSRKCPALQAPRNSASMPSCLWHQVMSLQPAVLEAGWACSLPAAADGEQDGAVWPIPLQGMPQREVVLSG